MEIPRPINHKAPSQLPLWHEVRSNYNHCDIHIHQTSKKTTLEHPWVTDKWILKPCFAVNKQNKSSNLLQFHLNGIIVVFMTNATPWWEYEHSWTVKKKALTPFAKLQFSQYAVMQYASLHPSAFFSYFLFWRCEICRNRTKYFRKGHKLYLCFFVLATLASMSSCQCQDVVPPWDFK